MNQIIVSNLTKYLIFYTNCKYKIPLKNDFFSTLQFVEIFIPQMDIFFRFRFISGILLQKVKTTFGNRMLFKLFNLKVKLQTGCFQESDEIKILTLESSSD